MTEQWKEELPASVLDRVKEWSQRAPVWPEKVRRSLAIDWKTGDSCLREQFTFKVTHDDWSTKLRQTVPVPPVLALAMQSEARHIATDLEVRDLGYVTAFGPYFGAEGTNEVVYLIPKLVNLVAEAPRFQGRAGSDPEAARARTTLEEATRALIATSKLDSHPWPWAIWRKKFTPGAIQFEYSSMLASLPYVHGVRCERLGICGDCTRGESGAGGVLRFLPFRNAGRRISKCVSKYEQEQINIGEWRSGQVYAGGYRRNRTTENTTDYASGFPNLPFSLE